MKCERQSCDERAAWYVESQRTKSEYLACVTHSPDLKSNAVLNGDLEVVDLRKKLPKEVRAVHKRLQRRRGVTLIG